MSRPNYYDLLDLSPSVKDWKTIEAALVKKRTAWSKDRTHPTQGLVAKRNLGLLADIELVLKDEETRKAEAIAWQKQLTKRKLEAKAKIIRKLNTLCAGGSIKEDQLKKLIKRHAELEESEIRSLLPAGTKIVKKDTSGSAPGPIDEALMQAINTELALVGKNDLYHFLARTRTSSLRELADAAREKDKKNKLQANKTAEVTAAGALIGRCIKVFKSEDTKKAYDLALDNKVFDAIKETIQLFAKGDTIQLKQFRLLTEDGVNQGLDEKRVEAYIKEQATKKGLHVEVGANTEVTIFPCGHCGSMVRVGEAFCSQCSMPAMIECPNCGTHNTSNNKSCTSCGFAIGDMTNAVVHIKEAKKYLLTNDLNAAAEQLRLAESFWSGHPDVKSVKKQLTDQIKLLNGALHQMQELIDQNSIYAAKKLSLRLTHTDERIDKLIRVVDKSIVRVDDLLKKARHSTDPDVQYVSYNKALQIASDCKEAQNALKTMPPLSPIKANLVQRENKTTLNWTAAKQSGQLQYLVMKKNNGAPAHPLDGEKVYKGKDRSCTTTVSEPGVPVYFAVFTIRNEVYSNSAAISDASFFTPSLLGVSAKEFDKSVELRWINIPSAVAISVQIDKVNARGGAKPILLKKYTNRDHLNVQGLENEVNYRFSLSAIYQDQIGVTHTALPVILEATPQGLPDKINSLQLVYRYGRIHCSWRAAKRGEVVLYYRNDSYAPYENLLLEKSSLSSLGSAVKQRTPDSAIIAERMEGKIFVLPVVVSGNYHVAGKQQIISRVSPPDHLHISIENGRVKVEWKWLKGIEELILEYQVNATHVEKKIISKNRKEEQSAHYLRPIGNDVRVLNLKARHRANDVYSDVKEHTLQLVKPRIEYEITKVSLNKSRRTATLQVFLDKQDEFEGDIQVVQGLTALPLHYNDLNNKTIMQIKDSDFKSANRIIRNFEVSLPPKGKNKMYFKLFHNGQHAIDVDIVNNKRIITI